MEKIDTKKIKDKMKEQKELHDFYTLKGSASGVTIKFDKLMFIERMRKLGFVRYDHGVGKFEYVRLQDGKIKLASILMMKDAFEDFLYSLPDREVKYGYTDKESGESMTATTVITGHRLRNILYDSAEKYFGTLLDRLRPVQPIEIMKDDCDYKYFYFANCVVKVTKDGAATESYDAADGYIWESGILDREYQEDNTTGEFERFVENICNHDSDRKKSLMTMLGYLMHDNYEANLRAVLLTDVNLDGQQAAGGTGKGMLGKALSYMLNRDKNDTKYCAIAGKGFDASDDKRYQLADISTQLIHIEDLDKRFDISSLYNDIADGATFRKMYESKNVHFTKFLLSVNHTIRIDSSSDKRRIYIFELHNHYNEDWTPVDEFKHMFWSRDWSQDEWHRFDTFMVRCVREYLRYGVIQAKTINYGTRRLNEVFAGQDDYRWFIQYEVGAALHEGKHLYKNELWAKFIDKYPIYNNKKGRDQLTKSIKTFLGLAEIPFREVHGNGRDYFVLNPEGAPIQTKLFEDSDEQE